MNSFEEVSPVGAGKEKFRALQMLCPGHQAEGEFLRVFVVAEYIDIFGNKRETTVGYRIFSNVDIYHEALPDRNRNT